jgi:hypothetical protein
MSGDDIEFILVDELIREPLREFVRASLRELGTIFANPLSLTFTLPGRPGEIEVPCLVFDGASPGDGRPPLRPRRRSPRAQAKRRRKLQRAARKARRRGEAA